MLLVSYPDIKDEKMLPVYVSGIGIDYHQESFLYRKAGTPQFLFSMEGTGEVTIGGTAYELPVGSGIYLRGTLGYRCHPLDAEWKVSWLTFGFGIAECAEMLFLGRDWCLFDARRKEEHRKMIQEIYSTVALDSSYGGYRASAMLYGMLIELNGELLGSAAKAFSANSAMENIIAYIDQNYTKDITLDQLCTAAGGLSEQYLCRLFKQSTGMRPMEYMLRRRISAARTYLEKTDMSISEVAVQSGFNNTSYFYRNFRKFVGVSPLTYRQNALGVGENGGNDGGTF